MANLHQDLIAQAQVQADKANANHSGDKYVAQAIVHSIESNGRLEQAIQDFNKATAKQSVSTTELARAQVKLARSQTYLAKVAIGITLIGIIVAIILKYT